MVGLGLALSSMGKTFQMILADDVPKVFRFMSGTNQIKKVPQGNFVLICVLDTSDIERTGNILDGYGQPDINIDHHVTNIKFGKLNFIDETAVSTTEMLVDIIDALDIPITSDIASALMVGLVTDTLGFRTPNMTSKAMETVAKLMDSGANLYKIYQNTLISRTYSATELWGCGLNNLQRDGNIVWTSLTIADRKSIGYPGRDDADLINVLSSIKEAHIALLFNEQKNGSVKVSWRAQPGYDVSKIALTFGGGGHPAASGADIPGSLENVQKMVLQETSSLIEKR